MIALTSHYILYQLNNSYRTPHNNYSHPHGSIYKTKNAIPIAAATRPDPTSLSALPSLGVGDGSLVLEASVLVEVSLSDDEVLSVADVVVLVLVKLLVAVLTVVELWTPVLIGVVVFPTGLIAVDVWTPLLTEAPHAAAILATVAVEWC